MTEMNRCKKCARKLPTNYKYKECESCRNKKIDSAKDILKVGVGLAVTLALKAKLGGKSKR